MRTFFTPDDYRAYLELIIERKAEHGITVWAYCLMPNHVHLVLVPQEKDSLAGLFRSVHRHYTRRINFRENWRGHLWQERFHSFVMDEKHLLSAVRYTELNPVRAGLCPTPEQWPWSSVHAHIGSRRHDPLVDVEPMLTRVENWSQYLAIQDSDIGLQAIRCHSRTGRPLGSDQFIRSLEAMTGKCLEKQKPGPKAGDK
jgi:putative transposase